MSDIRELDPVATSTASIRLNSSITSAQMLSTPRGDAATAKLQSWAAQIVKPIDGAIDVEVLFEADSNTYIVRLAKAARVLIFRLSASQVHSDGREAECARTLLRKVKDLWNLI